MASSIKIVDHKIVNLDDLVADSSMRDVKRSEDGIKIED